MDKLPECLTNKIYKLNHEMIYSKVMKQLKTYRLNTVFIVSIDFLDHGYFDFGGVRTRSIDLNNIHATSYEILCLIHYDKENHRSNRWRRPYGRVH